MNTVTATYTDPTGAKFTSTFQSWANNLIDQYSSAKGAIEKEHGVEIVNWQSSVSLDRVV